MTATIIRFIDLLLVALLAGTTFGIWLGFDPAGLSATTYVEQQQHAIRALSTLLPATGALCIVLTLILAMVARAQPACPLPAHRRRRLHGRSGCRHPLRKSTDQRPGHDLGRERATPELDGFPRLVVAVAHCAHGRNGGRAGDADPGHDHRSIAVALASTDAL